MHPALRTPRVPAPGPPRLRRQGNSLRSFPFLLHRRGPQRHRSVLDHDLVGDRVAPRLRLDRLGLLGDLPEKRRVRDLASAVARGPPCFDILIIEGLEAVVLRRGIPEPGLEMDGLVARFGRRQRRRRRGTPARPEPLLPHPHCLGPELAVGLELPRERVVAVAVGESLHRSVAKPLDEAIDLFPRLERLAGGGAGEENVVLRLELPDRNLEAVEVFLDRRNRVRHSEGDLRVTQGGHVRRDGGTAYNIAACPNADQTARADQTATRDQRETRSLAHRSGGNPGSSLRRIPAVSALLDRAEIASLASRYSRVFITDLVREAVEELRRAVAAGEADGESIERFADTLSARLDELVSRRFGKRTAPVINATGVILHTNLGRAPLSKEAVARAVAVASGYCDLEYDIPLGERGSRQEHIEELLGRLFPGSRGFAVNNNAAGLILAMNTLAEGREVLISRGELVEIGGSFRIPDVMAKSGAILHEVGTTNRTRIEDFQSALTDRTGLILRVHRSNYRIIGFTEEASLAEMAALARGHGIPIV